MNFQLAQTLERQRQDLKWGIQNHQSNVWLSILAEEFGEVAKALNETTLDPKTWEDLKTELVQVAAVAQAWHESVERNGQ